MLMLALLPALAEAGRRKPLGFEGVANGSLIAVNYQTTGTRIHFGESPDPRQRPFSDDRLVLATDRAVYTAEQYRLPPASRVTTATSNAHTRLYFHVLNEPDARWVLVTLFGPDSTNSAAAVAQRPEARVHLKSPWGHAVTAAAQYADLGASAGMAGGRAERLVAADRTAIYRAEQARAGQQIYALRCRACHDLAASNRNEPASNGPRPATADAALITGDTLLMLVSQQLSGGPGSMSQQDYVQVMSYLLQQNGYPDGTRELSWGAAMNLETVLDVPTR